MRSVQVGIVGCGMISGIYLQNCVHMFEILEVVACADLRPELAQARAAEFGVPRACSVAELLDDPEIEIVVNLTSPQAHAALNLEILRAGKHVYTEKPFALTREDADAVLALARANGLRVGCAPDTFLGAGLQTSRALIDAGAIGTPYAANGLILMGNVYDGLRPGFESYLQPGWDPLFDMAPYYLTALVNLLGAVRSVSGATAQLHQTITISDPRSARHGESVAVGAPMNAAATLVFESGALAALQAAKESFGYTPRLEIYGSDGILHAPDPNTFGGPVRVQQRDGQLKEFAVRGWSDNSRGIGVADMATAIRSGRPHRASGELARHVLDATLGIFDSSRSLRHVPVEARCERPAPLPPGLPISRLDP